MQELVLTSRPSQGALLGPGRHLVELVSITPTKASVVGKPYTDAMSQFAIKFQGADGKTITMFANTYGVKRFGELSAEEQESGDYTRDREMDYAIDVATGERVKDEERTESCIRILEALAFACGTPKGETVKLGELVGSELGIQVEENDRGNLRVAYTVPASQAQTATEEAAV